MKEVAARYDGLVAGGESHAGALERVSGELRVPVSLVEYAIDRVW